MRGPVLPVGVGRRCRCAVRARGQTLARVCAPDVDVVATDAHRSQSRPVGGPAARPRRGPGGRSARWRGPLDGRGETVARSRPGGSRWRGDAAAAATWRGRRSRRFRPG